MWVWVAQGDSLAQARRMWLRLGHCCPSCGGDRQTESATCQWPFQHFTSHFFHRLTASSPGYKVPSSEVNLCTTHSKSYVLEPYLTPVLWTVPGGRLSQESLKTFSHPLHRERERDEVNALPSPTAAQIDFPSSLLSHQRWFMGGRRASGCLLRWMGHSLRKWIN